MTENILIFSSVTILIVFLFVYRLYFKVDYIKEKEKFINENSGRVIDKFIVNIFISYPASQMYDNSVDNGPIYKITESLSWQYLEVQNASFSPVQCDSIVFTDKAYPSVCWIKSTFLKALFKSNDSISRDLEEFLNKYNFGIESGKWGAVLIREKRAILASEFESILNDFSKLNF